MSKLSAREWHAISRMYGICDKYGRFHWSEEALAESLWLEGPDLVNTMATLAELKFAHPYEVNGMGYAVIDRFDQDAKKAFIKKRGDNASEIPAPPNAIWIAAQCDGDPVGAPGARIVPRRVEEKREKFEKFSQDGSLGEILPTPNLTTPNLTEGGSGSPKVQSTESDPAGSPSSKALPAEEDGEPVWPKDATRLEQQRWLRVQQDRRRDAREAKALAKEAGT